MTLLVAPCSFKAARYAVENWHYSRRMPMPPLAPYGVWEDGRYVGVVLFARGANKSLLKPYGLDQTQGAELVRVALRDHVAPVSQIVALAVALLKKTSPGLRLLVSYADPGEGHHGGIYQAMNWVYSGQTSAERFYRDPQDHTRIYHPRAVKADGYAISFGKRTRVPKHSELEPVILAGKFRYLLGLDRAMARQVAKLARAYPPPRGRGVGGDAPVVLTGEAGSTPADRSMEGAA